MLDAAEEWQRECRRGFFSWTIMLNFLSKLYAMLSIMSSKIIDFLIILLYYLIILMRRVSK